MSDGPQTPDDGLPPLDFSGLVVSYATSALISLGATADPETGKCQKADLASARHMIDVLAMLEAKTKGNLTVEEEQLLSKLLFDCRMAFVNARQRCG